MNPSLRRPSARKGYPFLVFVFCTALFSCREAPKEESTPVPAPAGSVEPTPPETAPPPEQRVKPLDALADTTFVRLADYSDGFSFDLRYATDNNFLKEVVYDCGECYTRVKTARALLEANADFEKQGLRIRFYDCYRPNSVQYKMWELVPNPQYVANPDKGSIHNKGGAVDITLETLGGEPLDMGTDFDFFGPRAHHDHTDLPEEVLRNRRVLKETMERHGFWSIRTEWWHYNLSAGSNDPVADFRWPCSGGSSPD